MNNQDLAAHTAAQTGAEAILYKQVALRLAELIEHGTLRPGERVPSVRKCSQQQNVSIATVTQAYRLLEDRGLIEARPQSGYYVRVKRWTPPPEPSKTMPSSRAVKVSAGELVMQMIKAAGDPSLVRLGATLPNLEMCPIAELNRTMASVGRRFPAQANSYDSPPGNLSLRTQVARRGLEAGCTLAPDDILTTVGVTEGINLCLRAVAKPGDVIGVESPTFFGVLQIIASLGMRVCELPTYPREGICLDELAKRLKCCRIKACVFTLNYSNPLGSCMPDEKKRELVRLLSAHEIPLIEDDLYANLTFSDSRPKAAKAFDTEGWVMLCDSFTKTLSPGYRVGWVAAGRFREKVNFLKYVNTSASPSLPAMAVAEFLQNGGYDHHLRKIRRFYAEQMRLVTEAVSKFFPEGTKVTRPGGGMSLWIELPRGTDALQVYDMAKSEKISIAPGHLFSAKPKFTNFIRISCGNPWCREIEAALGKLGNIAAKCAARS
jgi:DNA-binding transcriptional MocR family regulator